MSKNFLSCGTVILESSVRSSSGTSLSRMKRCPSMGTPRVLNAVLEVMATALRSAL